MPVSVVVGLGFGDEGKGKIVDILASTASCVARGQGGNNAGHTVIAGGEELHFHLIPSGALHPNVECFLGAGVVIDPEVLLSEIASFEKKGISLKGRLWVSPYAHAILPEHIERDRSELSQKIGTTGRGIGPCMEDRVARRGKRIGELDDSRIKPWVRDFEEELIERSKKENVLLEGAQGALLDVLFGTVPYVTSSSTITSGICQGVGITRADRILGVAKAFATRVGNGPLPTELSKEELSLFPGNEEAREMGTTTGRKRRMGWFDAPMTRRAARLCGVDEVALMKLDILDRIEKILVCTDHDNSGAPQYEELAGWHTSTKEARTFSDLPKNAQAYVVYLEKLLGVPISGVSVGPEREAMIWR